MQRILVRLRHRYPSVSRMTIWRIKKAPGFPDPVIVNGVEYFVDSELTAHEEQNRRRARPAEAAGNSTDNA